MKHQPSSAHSSLHRSTQRSVKESAAVSHTTAEKVRREILIADGQSIEYEIRKHQQAKRVSLKVSHDGRVWISVPPRASLAQAREFAESNIAFIQKALHRVHQQREEHRKQREEEPLRLPIAGEWANVQIYPADSYSYRYDADSHQCVITLPKKFECATPYHIRTSAIAYWRYQMIQQANTELPERTILLAQSINATIRRVTVRDQRTVWGSCSAARKSISLNWRCVVFPADVRDYLILHELAHLRHPNHSEAYWQWVATICPRYEQAEQWLAQHGRAIMDITTI
jgi:predicted metal-dependent hydrolase